MNNQNDQEFRDYTNGYMETEWKCPQLKVGSVLGDMFKLSGDLYSKLLLMAVASFLFSFASSYLNYFRETHANNPMTLLPVSLMVLMCVLVFFPLVLLFEISSYIMIQSKMEDADKPKTISQSFKQASPFFWRFFGVAFCLGALTIFPSVILALFKVGATNQWVGGAVEIFGRVYSLLIFSAFGFAPILLIFEPGKGRWLKKSKALVKGNLLKVMMVIVIVNYLVMVPYWIFTYLVPLSTLSPLYKLVAEMGDNLIMLLIKPLQLLASMVMFMKLKNVPMTAEEKF